MIEKIKNLLPGAVRRAKIKRELRANEVCRLYTGVVREIVSERAAQKSKAISLRNKVLKVAVLSSVWAQELELYKHRIILKINKRVGEDVVRGIRWAV